MQEGLEPQAELFDIGFCGFLLFFFGLFISFYR